MREEKPNPISMEAHTHTHDVKLLTWMFDTKPTLFCLEQISSLLLAIYCID